MVIISITNIKGGVGKTTTAVNLAGEIAQRGMNVLLVDNDPQSNLSQSIGLRTDYTIYDLYINKKVTYEDCLAKINEHTWIIPNDIKSAALESELVNRGNRENILKNKLNTLKNPFDFMIIDNNPFVSILLKNALTMSDYYLEVIDNSLDAMEGLNMIHKAVNDIIEDNLNDALKSIGILRSRFDKVTSFSKQYSETMEQNYGDILFESIVYDSVKYKEARAMKKFIQEYSKEHAEVYKNIFDEILERLKKDNKY